MDPLEPVERPGGTDGHALGETKEQALDASLDGPRRRLRRRGDGLDRFALGDHLQQRIVLGVEAAGAAHRADECADHGGVEHRAAGGDFTNRPGQLVALGDAILEQVGVAGGALRQQRDRVVGVVVLAEDDDARAGMALADELARLDAFAMEVGWHADVADHDVRRRGLCAGDETIVILCLADDLEVGLARASP